MIKLLPKTAAMLAASLLVLSTPACARQAEDTISAADLREDIAEWRDWLFATHPDPSFSMDVETLNARFDSLAAGLEGHYSRRRAWVALSVMNPLFNDGHVVLRTPQEDYDAYLDTGGAEFTLPVRYADGHIYVAESVAPGSRFAAGEEIHAINGQAAADIAAQLLVRINGDSDGLRIYLLEERFESYLWALTGGADSWAVTVSGDDGETRTIALDPARDTGTGSTDNWSLAFDGDAAILTVNTFMPDLEADFAAFLETAFADIAAQGSTRLVIDISHNGGGAHQLSDRLFAYITDTRYTPLSGVTARITPENQALIPGSEIGQVVSVPFAQWVEPPAEQENRFAGDVAILVGPGTYSQAIVMAATAQDFDIAPVAGPGTEGRANSTGQVQLHRLAHSDLEVTSPIYIFIRASGDTSSAPVAPDIPLSGSREHQIGQLIDWMRTAE